MPNVEPLPPAPAGWERDDKRNDRLRAERVDALIAHGVALQQQEGSKEALQRREVALSQRWAAADKTKRQHPFYNATPERLAAKRQEVRAAQAARREAVLKMIKREEEEKQAKAKEAAEEAAAIAAFQAKLRQKRV
jgi:hypothetical protein